MKMSHGLGPETETRLRDFTKTASFFLGFRVKRGRWENLSTPHTLTSLLPLFRVHSYNVADSDTCISLFDPYSPCCC